MKLCIKCGVYKELQQFYKHSRMKDGTLNKCISCCKEYRKKVYVKIMNDPHLKNKELKRTRAKEILRRKLGKASRVSRESHLKYKMKYPEKIKAQKASFNIKAPKGMTKHHWSYNDAHFTDVIFLSFRDHKKAHRFIQYDQNKKMYRRKDTGALLDNRANHEVYIMEKIMYEQN